MMFLELMPGLPTFLFDLIDNDDAYAYAKANNLAIYTWKTEGYSNWLEKGISIVDNLSLALLPEGLPDNIDLPVDSLDDDD